MRHVIALLPLLFPIYSFAEIEVFTIDNWSPDYADNLYDLAKGKRLKDDLNHKFKSLGIRNETDAKKYITSDFTSAVAVGIQSTARAAKYKLRYLPAVVVDGEYVLYGKPSIDQILRVRGDND